MKLSCIDWFVLCRYHFRQVWLYQYSNNHNYVILNISLFLFKFFCHKDVLLNNKISLNGIYKHVFCMTVIKQNRPTRTPFVHFVMDTVFWLIDLKKWVYTEYHVLIGRFLNMTIYWILCFDWLIFEYHYILDSIFDWSIF